MCQFRWKVAGILSTVAAMSLTLSLVWWYILRSEALQPYVTHDWVLDWTETFNGTELDSTKWTIGTEPTPWVTPLDSTVSASNVQVGSSILYLYGNSTDGGYTSARVSSKFTLVKKKVVFRVKSQKNYGVETYIFMTPLAADCPQCLTILLIDNYGDTKGVIFGSVSYGPKWNLTILTESFFVSNIDTAFNDYAVEITDISITLKVNEQAYLTVLKNDTDGDQNYWLFDSTAFNIDMALVVGREYSSRYNYTSGTAPNDTTVFPAVMQLDSIMVYSYK